MPFYENLIKAEAFYDQQVFGEKDFIGLERLDVNSDGDEELFLKTPETVLLFSTRGGSLLEMDYRPKAFKHSRNPYPKRRGVSSKIIRRSGETSGEKRRPFTRYSIQRRGIWINISISIHIEELHFWTTSLLRQWILSRSGAADIRKKAILLVAL